MPFTSAGLQITVLLAVLGFIELHQAPALAQNGEFLYSQNCARCHEWGSPRVPMLGAMSELSVDEILLTLESGSMAAVTKDLRQADRVAIAQFVSKTRLERRIDGGKCNETSGTLALDGAQWNGWGNGVTNRRFQPAEAAALTLGSVRHLKLKWAFGFPAAISANAQPTIVGGRIFVPGGDRKVYALDATRGCSYWAFETETLVRTAISVGPLEGGDAAIYFGDTVANVYALRASTGALLWKVKVDTHPTARITGAPTLYSGALYVPVSSSEEAVGSRAGYVCCTFRGSVAALDAAAGRQIWKTYTIDEEARPTTNAAGAPFYGPSGAAVWTAPTIDAKLQALYITTGNSFSDPPADTSDAILALDLKTGAKLWHHQSTPDDSFIVGCFLRTKVNCPDSNGPDHDFAQSAILVTLSGGQRLLVVGQKSGMVYALDPDQQGKLAWQTRVGKGGALGGPMWGSAADQDHVYVANSDYRTMPGSPRDLDPSSGGGLFSLDLASGKIAWKIPPFACGERKQCSPAQSAAVTVIPGVVFSGGVSG
jgi:polyvinyl alcohol dehydrogenase (cytochrome)